VIDSIPEGRPVSVERETFPGLLASGARVSGHVDNAYWRDMGTPLDLVHGSADLVRGVAPSAALPGPTGEFLALDGAEVDPGARVFGGSTIGRGAVVGAGARVEGTMLFDGAVVGEQTIVQNSVIGAGARVEAGAVVTDAVVGDRAVVGEQCELRGGIRIWPDVVLPARGVRFSPDV
jgi:mannose-1-phosphate guanylyltransferase